MSNSFFLFLLLLKLNYIITVCSAIVYVIANYKTFLFYFYFVNPFLRFSAPQISSWISEPPMWVSQVRWCTTPAPSTSITAPLGSLWTWLRRCRLIFSMLSTSQWWDYWFYKFRSTAFFTLDDLFKCTNFRTIVHDVLIVSFPRGSEVEMIICLHSTTSLNIVVFVLAFVLSCR